MQACNNFIKVKNSFNEKNTPTGHPADLRQPINFHKVSSKTETSYLKITKKNHSNTYVDYRHLSHLVIIHRLNLLSRHYLWLHHHRSLQYSALESLLHRYRHLLLSFFFLSEFFFFECHVTSLTPKKETQEKRKLTL